MDGLRDTRRCLLGTCTGSELLSLSCTYIRFSFSLRFGRSSLRISDSNASLAGGSNASPASRTTVWAFVTSVAPGFPSSSAGMGMEPPDIADLINFLSRLIHLTLAYVTFQKT